jgi:hydroxymethylpyrimidine/phosphomethylpyrimidine kinase
MRYRRALTIAGSDSGGGAGLQADLKTFAALGCYGMSVVTALTAQNTRAVTAIEDVSPDFVGAQLDAVLADIGADVVKIGMLSRAEVIAVVAERLRAHGVSQMVLDPVMVAKSGDRLLQADATAALRELLLPLATVVTPNVPEAEVLTRRAIGSAEDMETVGAQLLRLGPRTVLLKGGHLEGAASDDLFLADGERHWLAGARVATRNTHGTGCTLASAVAARLAHGDPPRDAVTGAKRYVSAAIAAGADLALGGGHGPVHHFHALWPPEATA